MGPDRAKQFLKKNADRIPAGENVLGVIIGEAKGGAWRRGIATAGSATALGVHDTKEKQRGEERQQTSGGDAARWPAAAIFWLAVTDRQLHVFEGRVNSQEVGQGVSYPLDRIARMDYDKKLLISKLNITFSDGSSIELDVAKQKMQPFLDAISAKA